MLDVLLSGGKNTCIYISTCMGICLCASVTPTWSINEPVTREDVNDNDEEPKEKEMEDEQEKKEIYVKSRFIYYFLLEYQDKRMNWLRISRNLIFNSISFFDRINWIESFNFRLFLSMQMFCH
jgi:hypothetical protein